MAILVICSNCNKQLQAPDDAGGKKVRCPKCQTINVVPMPSAAEDELVESDDSPPSPKKKAPRTDEDTAVSQTPQKKKKPAWQDEEEKDDYAIDEDDAEQRRRNKRKRDREADDEELDRIRRKRRSAEPHRGTTILVMGILTIIPFCACPFICWAVGASVINMANTDLAKMERGHMDPDGQGITTTGKVCAIIGIVLGIINAIAGVALKVAGM